MSKKNLSKIIKNIFINFVVEIAVKNIIWYQNNLQQKVLYFKQQVKVYVANFFLAKLKRNLPLLYLFIFLFMAFQTFNILTLNLPITKKFTNEYNIFSAQPLVLGSSTVNLYGMDTRAKKIEGVFKAYNCPMIGTGEYIVEQADKNGIPYWIVPSIAFQESLCGKHTPEKNGVESYNAWGWAVYGNSSKAFKNYEHGIKVVSEYMGNRFYKRGITETCDIMKIYTPPSQGSWCRGVNYFSEKIQNFVTK
jgi:hypothetical protein